MTETGTDMNDGFSDAEAVVFYSEIFNAILYFLRIIMEIVFAGV